MAKPLGLRPFRQYLGMFLVLQMSMAIMSGLFFFYIDFFITKDATANNESSMVGLIAAALMFSMQIVALPVYIKMIEKRGKTFAYRFGAILWMVAALGILFIPTNANPILVYLLGAFMGFGISGPGLVPHTMYGDVVDAGQLVFGDRLDGQMSGYRNFMKKPNLFLYITLGFLVKIFSILKGQKIVEKTNIKGPAICLSNHTSFYDFIYTTAALYPKRVSYLAASKMFYEKSTRPFLKLARAIPKSLMQADPAATLKAFKLLKKKSILSIFPEGQIY